MFYTLSGGTCFESRSGYCLCEYESLSAFPEWIHFQSLPNQIRKALSVPYRR